MPPTKILFVGLVVAMVGAWTSYHSGRSQSRNRSLASGMAIFLSGLVLTLLGINQYFSRVQQHLENINLNVTRRLIEQEPLRYLGIFVHGGPPAGSFAEDAVLTLHWTDNSGSVYETRIAGTDIELLSRVDDGFEMWQVPINKLEYNATGAGPRHLFPPDPRVSDIRRFIKIRATLSPPLIALDNPPDYMVLSPNTQFKQQCFSAPATSSNGAVIFVDSGDVGFRVDNWFFESPRINSQTQGYLKA